MKKKMKFSFLFLLVFATGLWLYNFNENNSSEQNSNELIIEDEYFKNLIHSKETRAELIFYLKNNEVEFEDYYKDEHYVVNFNSFTVEYDKYGMKIK
mgnify:FL=1